MSVLLLSLVLAAQADDHAPEEPLLRAIELPTLAQDLRQREVRTEDVREVLQASRAERLSAAEARDVLDGLDRRVREQGPAIDNPGQVVRGFVQEGLRGRELAEAIRAHREDGEGRPESAGERPAAEGAAGRPEAAGAPESTRRSGAERGRPEAHERNGPPAEEGGAQRSRPEAPAPRSRPESGERRPESSGRGRP